jgi:hypothetical protein
MMMKFTSAVARLLWMAVLVTINYHPTFGFAPKSSLSMITTTTTTTTSSILNMGYLDDLSKDLAAPNSNPVPDEESREANVMAKDQLDRAGPGSWDSYVEFNEVSKIVPLVVVSVVVVVVETVIESNIIH